MPPRQRSALTSWHAALCGLVKVRLPHPVLTDGAPDFLGGRGGQALGDRAVPKADLTGPPVGGTS